MPASSTGYTPGGASPGPTAGPIDAKSDQKYWSLEKCKRSYLTYLESKREEIKEQQNARRYRHGVHWTAEQVAVLNRRKQPVVTYNRVGRKIDGIVGLVERLRQDPKAYPRRAQHQKGADLATAVLRFLMDSNDWKAKSPLVAENGAVDGIGGIELELVPGDMTKGLGSQFGAALAPPAGAPMPPGGAPGPPGMPPGGGFPGGGPPGPPGAMGGPPGFSPGPAGPLVGAMGGFNPQQQQPGNVMGQMIPPMPMQQAPQQPDMDVKMNIVDIEGYFYDPRSFKHDFEDARYQGMGKWVDVDLLTEMWPKLADQIEATVERGSDLTSNSDRDNRWFMTTGEFRRVRLVDLWYKHKGEWCYCIFTGGMKIMEGKSFLVDEKDKTFCKYIMFSAAIDQDGDRYGFVRNLQSAQDEINQRRSKGLHELNNRRLFVDQGTFDDVERARQEMARPDGIIVKNPGSELTPDDAAKQMQLTGHLEFLKEAKAEIENFGPNPAVLGDSSVKNQSGRAIALMQQAGIAELGPYMLGYRGWKLRVYRALFHTIQKSWNAERWIRVTDDQGVAQFVQINGVQVDPMTGMPQMVNAIGQLDVDIILDEGPDQITMMQDTYDAISQALSSVGPLLSPSMAKTAMEVLVESSTLPSDVKKKFKDAAAAEQQNQGPPPEIQLKMAELQMKQKGDEAKLAMDQQGQQAEIAGKQQAMIQQGQLDQQKAENDIRIANMKAMADIEIARAKASSDAEIKRESIRLQAESKPEKPEKSDSGGGDSKTNQVLAMSMAAMAKHFENSGKAKTVRKAPDGSYQIS